MVKMPQSLRNLFASICVWSHPTDPLFLFNKYKHQLIEDFQNFHHDETKSINLCLIELQKYFRVHGKRCCNFGLPEPVNFDYEDVNDIIDLPVEEKIANSLYKSLNINQLFVVDAITDKVFKFNPENQTAFFLDRSGKKY
jgi:hypothetical protein